MLFDQCSYFDESFVHVLQPVLLDCCPPFGCCCSSYAKAFCLVIACDVVPSVSQTLHHCPSYLLVVEDSSGFAGHFEFEFLGFLEKRCLLLSPVPCNASWTQAWSWLHRLPNFALGALSMRIANGLPLAYCIASCGSTILILRSPL